MRYIMFQKQFVDLIKSGTKRTTIRATSPAATLKRFPLHCEVSLRHWEDNPYRSKQIEFARARIVNIQAIKMDLQKKSVKLSEHMYGCDSTTFTEPHRLDVIARRDGFGSYFDMFTWFILNHHGDSFEGSRIGFEVIQ
jgi:hypothetical protein